MKANGSINTDGKTRHFSSSEFIIFEVIATLAFAGNLLVCILFARKKVLLKKTYNVYFLVLAVTDILISVTLASTPVFILSEGFPFSMNFTSAETICRILWSRWLLYSLGVFSVYICLLLTIERWFAVVKPMNYQGNFNKRKAVLFLVCAGFTALVFSSSSLFEIAYLKDRSGSGRCTWKASSGVFQRVWGTVRFFGECLAPSVIMVGLFAHVIFKTHNAVAPAFNVTDRRLSNMGRASQTQKTVIKMIGTASLFMILCWMPNQIIFLLSKFDYVNLDSNLHHYLEALTFFNSCINPMIYGITSKTFRKRYWEILLGFCPPKVRVRLAHSRSGLGESLGSVIFLVHTIHRRKSYDWRFEGIRPASTATSNQIVLSPSNF